MKPLLFAAFVACWSAGAFAAHDTIPSWIDTTAPVVRATPAERYQKAMFHVSLECNKHALIWAGFNSPDSLAEYRNPLTVMREGRTVVYFRAEDDLGNKSAVDSVVYVLDTKAPQLNITPDTGTYGSAVTLHFSCDEPCRIFRQSLPSGRDAVAIPDSLVVTNSFVGYISAEDRAGNRRTSGKLAYHVDTTTLSALIQPREGLYNKQFPVSFRATPGSKVYYTLDPNAPADWFKAFEKPVTLPTGLTLVRYFAKDEAGKMSKITQASFVIDTVPPKIRGVFRKGTGADTLTLATKKTSVISYTCDENSRPEDALEYRQPLVFRHAGRAYVKAVARDSAGNVSDLFTWEYRYDRTPPVVTPSVRSGTYNRPFTLAFSTSKPAKVLYTLDGSAPGSGAALYRGGIPISKEGATTVRFCALDASGNSSAPDSLHFVVDATPPKVKAHISGDVTGNTFAVTLASDKPARIFYTTGADEPSRSSPVYTKPVTLRMGQVMRYFAVDGAGNQSQIFTLDDLRRPMVSVTPEGGVFNKRVHVRFETNMPAKIYYRVPPDTAFTEFKDSLVLATEGLHAMEYYSETASGLRSSVRRNEYQIDWTAPQVDVSLRRGKGDSLIVLFEANKNATIYYTLDGTNPMYSPTTQIAANKFFMSRDRITLLRRPDGLLSFYAEDAAGNQGNVTVVDFFKPRVVPSVPAGTQTVYDHMLSVALNTYDERSQIYFERHAKKPTLKSPLYQGPITLVASDTILAFVVDASGYKGELDTFTYRIDLPPSAEFSFSPETTEVGRQVVFNASASRDAETPAEGLIYKWRFAADSAFEVTQKGYPQASHVYTVPGRYTATLEVVDGAKHASRMTKDVLVRGVCPQGMAFVPRFKGRSFCIDFFESSSTAGAVPASGVSWIKAKMYCLDAGKRLCTAEEWQYACRGASEHTYPYGDVYEKGRCPVDNGAVSQSGKYRTCGEGFGVSDMVGNLWEWVADKNGIRASMAGGSYRYGAGAHCGLLSDGNITTRSSDVGYRCCK